MTPIRIEPPIVGAEAFVRGLVDINEHEVPGLVRRGPKHREDVALLDVEARLREQLRP